MSNKLLTLSMGALLFAACESGDQSKESSTSTGSIHQEHPTIMAQYPESVRDTNVVENYHGTMVADPYRWMEDDHAEETMAWVEDQNNATHNYLDQIPFRDKIRERLAKVWNYPKFGQPFKAGDNYLFFKNDGMQNQSVLYIQSSLDATPEVFLDPNTWSENGTSSMSGFNLSHDNKYAAYGISEGGSDWKTMKVIDVATKKDLSDELKWIKFGGASWYKDGFFYSKYPAPKGDGALSDQNSNQKVYYHKLGDDQDKDQLIFEDPAHDKYYNFCSITDDERFLAINQSSGTSGNKLMIRDLSKGMNAPLVTVVDDYENDTYIIGNIGDRIFLYTNRDAQNYRIVELNLGNPEPENWSDVIAQGEMVLNGASLVGGKLVANYSKDVCTQIHVFNTDGQLDHKVELPGLGTANGFNGKMEDTEVFYTFTSFIYPPTIFRYNLTSKESTLFRETELDFDPTQYESRQLWITSKDGTKVPMFVVHKKGLKMDGSNPTYLYGYGGFNISLTPSFSTSRIILLENGGVYAQVNLRGGGEYGEAWHEAGMLDKKQNVFDDFIGAAEHLIKAGYTSSEKLAIAGGSNGGLLVGACMTQRPDLYSVAFPAVGVLDMLRFHKFTVGFGWVVEYGSSDNAEDFEYLYKYSPLHNLKYGEAYPATMIKTADHDDRVVPAHSFKFAAELQNCHDGESPVLIRIDTKAGHGAGKSTNQLIDEWADTWAFMFQNTNTGVVYQ